MRIAYADPPYIGQSKRHYGKEDSFGGEVDHDYLMSTLKLDYPDGWALSCSSSSLQEILWICHQIQIKPRIAAWVKPFSIFKKGVRPAYAWEPVLFMGGRNSPWYPHPPPLKGGKQTTPKDFVSANITLKKGLVGAKPVQFSEWLFWLMGMQPGDEFIDLYPGTGGVTRAWEEWSSAPDR